MISRRKFNEKIKIYLRRFISLVVNLGLIFSGLYLIIIVDSKQTEIIEYFEHINILNKFSQFVPTIIVTILNNALPETTRILVKFEMWDFPE